MAECIFCRIAKGEIPCAKVYEDEHTIAFLDIGPVNPGHTLVMPRQHFETLPDAPETVLHACMSAIRRVAPAVMNAVTADGMNILQNNRRAAGQLVDHIHFHLIPRFEGDGLMTSWPAKAYSEGELETMRGRVKAALVKP